MTLLQILRPFIILAIVFALGLVTGFASFSNQADLDSCHMLARDLGAHVDAVNQKNKQLQDLTDSLHRVVINTQEEVADLLGTEYPQYYGNMRLQVYNPDVEPTCKMATQSFNFLVPVSRHFYHNVDEGVIVKANAEIYKESNKYEFWELILIDKIRYK